LKIFEIDKSTTNIGETDPAADTVGTAMRGHFDSLECLDQEAIVPAFSEVPPPQPSTVAAAAPRRPSAAPLDALQTPSLNR